MGLIVKEENFKMIKELRNFIEYLSSKKTSYMKNSYCDGKFGFTNVETLSFPTNFELLEKFRTDERLNLTEEEISYLDDLIPDSFSDYVHYRGHFYFIDYGTGTASPVSKSQINEKAKIFDFSHCNLGNLLSNVRAGLNLIENALKNYDADNVYDDFNYTIEKEVPIPNETYDTNFSLTKEQSEAMRKWQIAHNKKFHKKGFGYQGVSPVSNFEIVIGSCSLGSYADCKCKVCMEEAEKTNDEKLKKKASFEVFNNM